MQTAFNFDFLSRPWEAAELRASIDLTLSTHVPIGASPTWVLSNHDVTRPVTKYGRADTSFSHQDRKHGMPTDLVLGERRARAAALLAMALPGGLYVYQGEELGLPEVEDLPDALLQDPIFKRSGGTDRGRDGCRVPLPWSGKEPPFGFGAGTPWLPQPADWKNLTVESQLDDQNSMMTLYRTGLRLRREMLGDGSLTWVESPDDVLIFEREHLTCVTNLTTEPIELPPYEEVLLTSIPLDNGKLPSDATAWIR
jgi:alpha-glucosidase